MLRPAHRLESGGAASTSILRSNRCCTGAGGRLIRVAVTPTAESKRNAASRSWSNTACSTSLPGRRDALPVGDVGTRFLEMLPTELPVRATCKGAQGT